MATFLWISGIATSLVIGFYTGAKCAAKGFYLALSNRDDVHPRIRRLRVLIQEATERNGNGTVH